MRYVQLFLVLLLMVPVAQATTSRQQELVNLDHLRFLTEPVVIAGQESAIVHIYSEYPEYEWIDATGEGISALDDVARAALVYLWHYEQTRDEPSLELARRCLNFTLYMQLDDGAFYNFVLDREGTINTEGPTSYKSLGWWAMRGLWALAEGYRIFEDIDPAYAARLQAAYQLTEDAVAVQFDNYGQYSQVHNFSIPAWIPGGATDVSSIMLLGLTAYYRANPNAATQALIEHVADGIAAYRLGDSGTYPFGMHPVTTNAPGYWHAWGSRQIHALAEAGAALNRDDWIESASEAANTFWMRQLAFERIREIGILPRHRGQIAYGTNVMVQGYMALYRATGEEKYAQYAGLTASWFFGNNITGMPMYDPDTGRGFDGIEGRASWRINRNAGAESTIEALMALLVVHENPIAVRYLHYMQTAVRPYVLREAEWGHPLMGEPDLRHGDWTGESYYSNGMAYSLGEGDAITVEGEIPEAGQYWVYVAHMRQSVSTPETQLVALQRSGDIVLDGNLDEWADVPVFSANTSRQILRGAVLWRGPDVDSFDIQFMWDDERLYIAATVRDPVFEQPETGPAVWGHDALWIYVDGTDEGKRLSAKFTLAQTPRGPQVWDWVGSGWQPNAELAWQETENGYIYEAAIPFDSLRTRPPQIGTIMGIEAGRGLGGDSFLDLTGADPDTAANLANLIFVEQLSDLDEMGGVEQVLNSAANAVAFSVTINDGEPIIVPANTSPDRRYLWLDLVGNGPVYLEAGPIQLTVSYAGTEPLRRAMIDGFLIQPVEARRVFAHPDGSQLILTYNTQTNVVTLSED